MVPTPLIISLPHPSTHPLYPYPPAHVSCPPLTIFPTKLPLLFSLSSCPPNVPTSYMSFSHLTFAPSPIFISSISFFTFPLVVPTSYNLSLPSHHSLILPLLISCLLIISVHTSSHLFTHPSLTHLPPTHHPCTVHPDTPVLARPANRAHPN